MRYFKAPGRSTHQDGNRCWIALTKPEYNLLDTLYDSLKIYNQWLRAIRLLM